MRRAALGVLIGVAQLAAGAYVSGDGQRPTALAAQSGASRREDSNCVSISPSANDFWCATNCGTGGHCPAEVCKCEEGLSKGDITDEQMDYLKSSSRDADKYSKEVNCMSVADVAKVWVTAIAPISSTNAIAMCAPAVAVAAASSFDSPAQDGKCGGQFHPTLKKEGGEFLHKGLWQITKGFDPDPAVQAVAVHNIYAGSDPNYGCLSSQCQATDCHLPIEGIGQDESVVTHHRFCRGKWGEPGFEGRFAESLEAIGGLKAVQEVCSAAAVKHGLRETVKKMSVSPVVAAKKTAKDLSEEDHILDFLRTHLNEIIKDTTAEMYANSIRVAMSKQGITTMKSAAKHIGKNMATAQDIIQVANVNIEPLLLQEWFKDGDKADVKKISFHDAKIKRASNVADEEALVDFLKARLNELFQEPTRTETYAKALMIAMRTKNLNSLKIGWATLGQDQAQAQEVITLANVQLQASVLSEWFRALDAVTLFPERADLKETDMPQAALTGSPEAHMARLHP